MHAGGELVLLIQNDADLDLIRHILAIPRSYKIEKVASDRTSSILGERPAAAEQVQPIS